MQRKAFPNCQYTYKANCLYVSALFIIKPKLKRMIKKMNIAFIASTLALLSTLYSCKKETTTNSELTVGPLELVDKSLTVAGATFKVAINDPAGIAGKKRLCYSSTVQSPTIDTAGKAAGDQIYVVDMGNNPSSIALTNLKMDTTYYVRAAVVTKSGAIVYSNVVTIKTPTIPVGTLKVVEEIGFDKVTLSTAGSGGVIVGSVYYSTASNPTTGGQLIDNEGKVELKDLIPGTTYYARIVVKTASGEVIYGPELPFTIRPCTIGAEYKGGIIFYIDGTKAHGLIAAKEDIGERETDPNKIIFPWGLNGIGVITTPTDGLTNTNNIKKIINNDAISAQTAAGQCALYKPSDLGSFQTEWYLPATEEWIILSNNESVIPKLKPDDYWTSTGALNNNQAWRMNLAEKDLAKRRFLFARDQKARVRAIHKF